MNSRLLIAILVSIFVITTTLLLIQFAKGYRPDLENGHIKATGLLVATSEPKGAQVYLDQQLESATDVTLDLDPGSYYVEIKKTGFIPWAKLLQVEKGLVTQTDALLFPITQNLQAVTSSGALNPSLSPNKTKLIYTIPESTSSAQLTQETVDTPPLPGLWLMELTNLPLGFNQDPKQLISGHPAQSNWTQAQFYWSPDSREILTLFYEPIDENSPNFQNQNDQSLITTAYLINTSSTSQPVNQLTNISNKYQDILDDWQQEKQKLLQDQIKKLPQEFTQLIATSSANLKFSPDETKLLYTATASAQLADQYLSPVLAASTQPQHRQLQANQTYLYDLKEDRNFLILNQDQTTNLQTCANDYISSNSSQHLSSTDNQPPPTDNPICPKLMWFPTSRHLIYFNQNKINIMEYDSTNNQVIYSGPIENNYAFPHPSTSKLLLVTNLNPDAFPFPNLYTLSLR